MSCPIRKKRIFILLGLLSASHLFYGQSIENYQRIVNFEERPEIIYDDLARSSILNSQSTVFLSFYDSARTYFKNSEYEKSRGILDSLININPGIPDLLFYRARCKYELGEANKAKADFFKILAMNEDQYLGPTRIELGYVYLTSYDSTRNARREFELALELMPDNALAIYSMAVIYYLEHKKGKAVQYARKCLEVDPLFRYAHYILITAAYDDKNYTKSKELISKFLAAFPDDEDGLIFQGAIYLKSGQEEFGLQTIRYCIRQHPNSIKAYRALSNYYYYRKYDEVLGFKFLVRKAKARTEKRKSKQDAAEITYQNRYDQVILFIAAEIEEYEEKLQNKCYDFIALIQKRRSRDAIYELDRLEKKFDLIPTGLLMLRALVNENFNRKQFWESDNLEIIRRNEATYGTYYGLAQYYLSKNDLENAELNFEKMIRLDPENENGYLERALVRMDNEKYIEAIQDLNIYISKKDADPVGYESRAFCYKEAGYPDHAVKDYEKAFELRESEVWLHSFNDMVAFGLMANDTTYVLDLLDKAVEKLESDWIFDSNFLEKIEALNFRGVLYMKMGQTEKAITDFTEAIELNTYFDLPYLNRGRILFDQGEYELAKRDFNRYISNSEGDPVGLYWRARARLELENVQGAVKDLRQAAKLGVIDAQDLLQEILK